MKAGYCLRCPKYHICVSADDGCAVTRELRRITEGRRRRIVIIYEHQLTEGDRVMYLTHNTGSSLP